MPVPKSACRSTRVRWVLSTGERKPHCLSDQMHMSASNQETIALGNWTFLFIRQLAKNRMPSRNKGPAINA